MHPVIAKTFGGLSARYYIRQFLFALIFPVCIYFIASRGAHSVPLDLIALLVVNTLLYPYSRFVYEGIIGFIVGQNVFWVSTFLLIFMKLMTMALCWSCAIFIAPIGLAYLYYYHSKSLTGRG